MPEIDYKEHIGLDSIVSILPQRQSLDEQILSELRNITFNTKNSNYLVVYEFDTSVTTKQQRDIYSEHGTYASSLYIDTEGGGFSLQINDSTHTILSIKGTLIYNEIILKISVTGTGNSGKGIIRLNLTR